MEKVKKKRGFAAISKEEHKRIASLGGKSSWKKGVAHKWTPEEAYRAGMKGGRPRKKKV